MGIERLIPAASARHSNGLWPIVALAVACALVLLYHLALAPVYLWDEARIAINATEMMRARNPIIITFHGQPDLWNPKPPLAIAAAALSMRIGGINELALRLPSALAAAACVFAVYGFTLHVSGRRATALLAGFLLLGTAGYVEAHVARSAEPDSLFVLFITLTTFALARSMEDAAERRRNQPWLYVAAVALALALLTKSVAALLILPGYAVGLVAAGKLGLLRSRAAAISAAGLALVVVLGWGGRELALPGYIAAVWDLDVARFGEPLYASAGPWYFYLVGLIWPWPISPLIGFKAFQATHSAFPWSLVLLAAAPLAALSRDEAIRRASQFLSWSLAGFIIMVSFAAAKLPWYVAPAYPVIAVLTALGTSEAAKRLSGAATPGVRRLSRVIMPSAFVVALACMLLVFWKNEQVERQYFDSPEERLGYFLRVNAAALPKRRPIRVVSDAQVDFPVVVDGKVSRSAPYDGPAEFYVSALQQSGHDIRMVQKGYLPAPSDLIVRCGAWPSRPAGFSVKLTGDDCAALSR